MKQRLIKKDPSSFKITPNLENYENVRKSFSWQEAKGEIEFKNGKLNAAYNAIERNTLNWRKNKVALYWLGAEFEKKQYTFLELNDLANQFANLIQDLNIDIGERVFFFLSRIPELYFGFLGALKRGAIAGTMFAAFGPEAIKDRLENSQAKVLVIEPTLFDRFEKIAKDLPELKIILVTGDTKEVKKLDIPGKKIISLDELLLQQ